MRDEDIAKVVRFVNEYSDRPIGERMDYDDIPHEKPTERELEILRYLLRQNEPDYKKLGKKAAREMDLQPQEACAVHAKFQRAFYALTHDVVSGEPYNARDYKDWEYKIQSEHFEKYEENGSIAPQRSTDLYRGSGLTRWLGDLYIKHYDPIVQQRRDCTTEDQVQQRQQEQRYLQCDLPDVLILPISQSGR